jgi:hypothetical protein
MYIHVTSCLIHPFRPHAVNASWFYVLFKFCFIKGLTQGPPLVTSLKVFFIAITLYFYVLFKFCFMREGTQESPLVNPLNNVFFEFMMQITS